ncbi:MAG: NAD(P)/FAD-dependent oxidoreductase [Erysipelotrichales bacterium]|nr:NAD(P)/FAD-dependent oxidoreductase [Erysipelotrichales bacterium]
MERFDIAIIGTGPAGLQASIVARIRNKKVLLLGSKELSSKLTKTNSISNYLGFGTISGEDLAKEFQKHIDEFNIEITEDKIQSVYNMGDYYALQGKEVMYEARAVILATGVVSSSQIKGEEEFLGRGVSYCATCDAPLYKNKTAIVIGYSKKEEDEARFLSEIADEVLYFPMYNDDIDLPTNIKIIKEKPLEIKKVDAGMELITNLNSYVSNGVFVLREAVSAKTLVPGLDVDGPHVIVDRLMQTNLPGLFACGDIVGLPYQYIKSAGEGNVAALSAVKYIDKIKEQD